MLRTKKTLFSTQFEDNQLEEIHNNILHKITQLDKLNQDYKDKLEEHFIKMFMNVLEKMGNDLILAQQAYRNIDIQIKRDKKIIQIAEQLSFFKDECFNLKKQIKKMKNQVSSTRLDYETIKNQIKSIRAAYQKKSKQYDNVKQINSQLKKQVKNLKQEDKNFKFSNSDKDYIVQLQSERENPFIWKQDVSARWIKTQQTKRRMKVGKSYDFTKQFIEERTLSPTKTNQNNIKFRTTNPSSLRKSSQQKSKIQQTQFILKVQ